MSAPTVALLGTGTMGLPMGRKIAAAGMPLRAWNRHRDKAEPLTSNGATVTDTAADAVAGADLIITMLYDADSVAAVIASAAESLGPAAIWLQMSTVGVAGADRLAALADELSLSYLDCPVLGTKKPAEDGALTVLASGPEQHRAAAQPVFDAVGSRTIWVGAAGAGSRLKLVANSWILALLEGMAESLKLADGLGLDPGLFLQAVAGGAMDAPYLQLKAASMLAGSFEPAFALSGAEKDAGLIIEAAQTAGVEMAVTEAARRYLQAAIEAGHGDEDMSAIYLAH
ncbi:MAG TPA: NAD(P)-dependent oxidoreductase [Jatrophihabitans sp.]|jgi:3-hydroxyisobutyrate dehydrogenase